MSAPPLLAGAQTGGADEPGVLAFATDSESEGVLREGLAGYPDAQVWPGGVSAAVTVLARGVQSGVLFVDLDGVAFPAGAIHELAEVCEVGTEVVAFGTEGSSRFCREVLLAGVSDYLVKPLGTDAVREAALRAGAASESVAPQGCVVAFVGGGGSGATTLAAALALFAAERGRYVSVLDLSRPFSALALALDVEPSAGLRQLLEVREGAALDADVVDAVRARRSERIAVYAHRFGAEPVSAPAIGAAVRLVGELGRRSHLVLIDGIGSPARCPALFAGVDRQVVVLEPTPGGASRGARILAGLEASARPVVVLNHTRRFAQGDRSSLRALRRAGVRIRPKVTVAFDPALPAIVDRGWPGNRLPRALETSVSALSALLLPSRGGSAFGESLTARDARSHHAPLRKPSSREVQSARRRFSPGSWWPRRRAAGAPPA